MNKVLLLLLMNTLTLFDFDKNTSLNGWYIVDDTVMGGKSAGQFRLSKEGHGEFYGDVSLENNGGFSSVRYSFRRTAISDQSVVKIRLKGDGKRYQFRVKDASENEYAYISYFSTSGDWEIVTLPLGDLYPTYRGRKLDLPNFQKNHLAEIAFLIGNKKAQHFRLLIDWIALE